MQASYLREYVGVSTELILYSSFYCFWNFRFLNVFSIVSYTFRANKLSYIVIESRRKSDFLVRNGKMFSKLQMHTQYYLGRYTVPVQLVKSIHQYFRFLEKSCQYRDLKGGNGLKWILHYIGRFLFFGHIPLFAILQGAVP